MRRSLTFATVIGAFLLAGVLPASARRAEYIRPIVKTLSAQGLTQLVIQNLVGPITIQTQDTPTVKVEILVHGGGMDEAFARTLTQQLDFQIEPISTQLRIIGHYPLEHFRDYGYPYMKSIMLIHGTDTNEYQGKTVHIRSVNSKKAVELWAEIRVTIPNSIGVVIRNLYGDVTVHGSGTASNGLFDGFSDVGDFEIDNPRWSQLKVQSDYGKVAFLRGFGAAQDIHVNTSFGGAYFYLRPGATGKILADKDLGFLHNNFTDSHFTTENGYHVMVLGDGHGTVVHVDMSVGSLHLERAAS